MNGAKQREHKNVREELNAVTAAMSEELEAIASKLQTLQLDLQREQKARWQAERELKAYLDGKVREQHALFTTFRDAPLGTRLRWLFHR